MFSSKILKTSNFLENLNFYQNIQVFVIDTFCGKTFASLKNLMPIGMSFILDDKKQCNIDGESNIQCFEFQPSKLKPFWALLDTKRV